VNGLFYTEGSNHKGEKMKILIAIGLILGSTFAWAAPKTITCTDISLFKSEAVACLPGEEDLLGGSNICSVNQVEIGKVERFQLTSYPDSVGDEVTITNGDVSETVACTKQFFGGQYEIVCTTKDEFVISYLPGSYDENSYAFALYVKEANAPSSTISSDDCTVQ